MILITVDFLEMNQSYDFKVDENALVCQVIEEMVEMISQTERFPLKKDPGLFLLCDEDREKVLISTATLAQNGVEPADKLLLV